MEKYIQSMLFSNNFFISHYILILYALKWLRDIRNGNALAVYLLTKLSSHEFQWRLFKVYINRGISIPRCEGKKIKVNESNLIECIKDTNYTHFCWSSFLYLKKKLKNYILN